MAFDKGDVLEAVVDLSEGDKAEVSVLSGHIHFFTYLDDFFGAKSVFDEVGDGDDGDIELLAYRFQLRQPCHSAIGVYNLDEGGGGRQSGKPHEVDCSFGVSATTKHAAVLRP